ncbi:unnamed protein product [Oppiella nova]|uniref:Major facilitator superfamily (MFS) profile domain-containing protein n=1 Tax=Oppiella nova TaxID=334625 RepID=A0A7R9QJ69_9ACAR|nr:unnamed protein product [Oppiella nova]CAG2166906.1 unnamed protein product [Oppiella nova]
MFLFIAFLIISPQIHFIDGKVNPSVGARGGPPAVNSKGIDDKEETPSADEGDNGGSTLDYEAIFSALDVISSAPMDVMGTPQRIGDLEFDVEVDEQIPEKGQKAPEVDVEDNKNNPMGGDGQVLTDVSVDLVSNSAKRIGDIELDMNVMNSRTRHPHHQKPKELTEEEEDVTLQVGAENPEPVNPSNGTPIANNDQMDPIKDTDSKGTDTTKTSSARGANGGDSQKWALILMGIIYVPIYCKPNKRKEMVDNQKSNVKHVADIVGEWGKWQLHLVIVMNGNSIGQICDRANFASFSQTLFMLGYVISGLVFSHYSDKYGRRPIVWLGFTIELTGILLCAVSPNIYYYSIARFLVGMGGSGRGMAMSDITILGGIGWVIGYAGIPGLAYWLQDYRYMQFASLIPLTVMLFWFYFLYESPRWQITNGQVDRAEQTLKNALKMNGKSNDNLKTQVSELFEYLQKMQSTESAKQKYTILDLVKTPKLRKITFITWFSWATNALLYYGFSLNMSEFGGNFYITFLLSGLVEIPSYILPAIFLRFIGRRILFAIFMLITGVSCFAVIPSTSEWLKVMFALLGKLGINSAWNVMFVHIPELYPTVLRQRGVGVASVISRIGSISATFMKNLTATSGLSLVMTLYGTLTCVGAVLGLFLPETKGREIPDTIEEAENVDSIQLNNIKDKQNENNGKY